jgi:methyl-accepting chemotaxis protein
MKLNIRSKLFIAFGSMLVLLAVVGFIGWWSITNLLDNFSRLSTDNLQGAIQLANTRNALWELRFGIANYTGAGSDDRAQILAQQDTWYQQIDSNLRAYKQGSRTPEELAALEEWEETYPKYVEARPRWFQLIDEGKIEEAAEWHAQNTNQHAKASVAIVARLIELQQQNAVNKEHEAETVAVTTMWILIGAVGFALVGGLGLVFFLSWNIASPLVKITEIARAISVGNLDVQAQVTSSDETGILANAFNQMISYQQEMAGVAGRLARGDVAVNITPQSDKDVLGHAFTQMITYQQEMAHVAGRLAEGDLTANVTPQSDKDVLGQAFRQMITNLRDLIGQVIDTANTVSSASGQLATTAEQASQASQQVASTIQQIAQGTTQQTQGVTEATNNVEQLSRAADGIARGAQDQANGVQKTSTLSSEMAGIVEQVGQVARSVSEANTQVTQVARRGTGTVGQAGQGMDVIRTRTLAAADKIKEMSERSREIGRIVETIDDIADKTDMLALNAAVEAARAGEHGRGFAVVADQVRKLSEDSKSATRDIGGLIERVQETVREVITAMDSTVTEVGNGTRLVGDTVKSLEEILQAAEGAATLAERITDAVAQLRQKSEGVVTAIESVSAVVEENTAVSEEMAASSREVMSAMEGVASVAEENSASAEEVSASAEEMSAQVEEVVASAQELSLLAEQLREAVDRFRLDEGAQLEWKRQGQVLGLAGSLAGSRQPGQSTRVLASRQSNGHDHKIG